MQQILMNLLHQNVFSPKKLLKIAVHISYFLRSHGFFERNFHQRWGKRVILYRMFNEYISWYRDYRKTKSWKMVSMFWWSHFMQRMLWSPGKGVCALPVLQSTTGSYSEPNSWSNVQESPFFFQKLVSKLLSPLLRRGKKTSVGTTALNPFRPHLPNITNLKRIAIFAFLNASIDPEAHVLQIESTMAITTTSRHQNPKPQKAVPMQVRCMY